MNDETNQLVVELAKQFIAALRTIEPRYSQAFWRFRSDSLRYGSNASCRAGDTVKLISAVKNAGFYSTMNAIGKRIFDSLGRSHGVCLLTVDDKFDYQIQFDWNDIGRWEITKVNGGTGVPAGI